MNTSASPHRYIGTLPALALIAPLSLLLLALFVYPLVVTLWNSLHGEKLILDSYIELARSTLFLKVLKNTFEISIASTLVSCLIGYPVALHLSRQTPKRRVKYMMFIMLPFWTSILVKSFALTVIFGNDGVLNTVLRFIGGPALHFPMMFNRFGAVVGMINYLLPFMIFSILGSLLAQDANLRKAAEVMGASAFRIFQKVTFPLSLPGVMAGLVINFTLCVGMYITPALLGGRQDMMIANLIDFYTHQTLDWPMASAISIVLLSISGVLLIALGRIKGSKGVSGASA